MKKPARGGLRRVWFFHSSILLNRLAAAADRGEGEES